MANAYAKQGEREPSVNSALRLSLSPPLETTTLLAPLAGLGSGTFLAVFHFCCITPDLHISLNEYKILP